MSYPHELYCTHPQTGFYQQSLQSLLVFVECISYTLHCDEMQHGRADYLSPR